MHLVEEWDKADWPHNVFGVTFTSSLSVTTSTEQSLQMHRVHYALNIVRAHGLCDNALQAAVCSAVSPAFCMPPCSAWSSMMYWKTARKLTVFSERELTFAICCRPSVCRLSVTFVHPTQPVEIFGNVSTPFSILTIRWHPRKILRRSSQGSPSVGVG